CCQKISHAQATLAFIFASASASFLRSCMPTPSTTWCWFFLSFDSNFNWLWFWYWFRHRCRFRRWLWNCNRFWDLWPRFLELLGKLLGFQLKDSSGFGTQHGWLIAPFTARKL